MTCNREKNSRNMKRTLFAVQISKIETCMFHSMKCVIINVVH